MVGTSEHTHRHLGSCAWFWAWAAAGAAIAIGLISLGWLVIVPALIAIPAMARRSAPDSALGLVSGAGLPFLLVAYLQRRGPGTHCWSHAGGGSGCDSFLNPLPWLVIGVALVATGIAAFAYVRRSQP